MLKVGGQPTAEPKAEPTEVEIGEAVPSQADLFKGIGERLGVELRKDRAKDENRAKIG